MVNPIYIDSISLSVSEIEIEVGEKYALDAAVFPANASNKEIEWSSSSTDVAIVGNTGMVVGISEGYCFITASAKDGSNRSDDCLVHVKRKIVNVASIVITPMSTTLKVGETIKLTAMVLPQDATNKCLSWSSSNESVATVDTNGIVTSHNVGTASISVASTDGSDLTAMCELTVTSQLVEDIKLSETHLVLNVGDEFALEVSVLPSNATDKSIVWTSSDSTIVRVEDGKVTAVSEGTATIVSTTADGSNVSTSCEVEVIAPASGIDAIVVDAQRNCNIYTIGGVLIKLDASQEDITKLAPSCYIINGKTIVVK
jgi:uncharacterized protein YjdB